jgi:hypothetical protein
VLEEQLLSVSSNVSCECSNNVKVQNIRAAAQENEGVSEAVDSFYASRQ